MTLGALALRVQKLRKTAHHPGSRVKGRRRLAVILAAVLVACGTTVVTIRVDVRSFLSEDELSISYGDPPLIIPGNSPAVSIQTPVEIIPLPDEINTITDISAIEILAAIDFNNRTGSAAITYRVYFNDTEENIFNTDPILEQQVYLVSDSTSHEEILIEGDQRVLNLFLNKEIAMASEIEIEPGGGTENISGSVDVTGLTVQVSAVGEN